jgi:hypothetical protein
MGHNIKLYNKDSNEVASTYISFKYHEFLNYFHISEINGHSGKNGIIKKLSRTLKLLIKDGVNPKLKLKVDCCGTPLKEFKLDENELKVQKILSFYNIINSFFDLSKKYPDAYWYSDQVCDIDTLNGWTGKKDLNDEDSYDEYDEYPQLSERARQFMMDKDKKEYDMIINI